MTCSVHKINGKSCKYILICSIRYSEPNRVEPLYLIVGNAKEYIQESNGSKYLTIVPTYESNDAMKQFEEIWRKIKQ